MPDADTWESPEQVALRGWDGYPAAGAVVTSVTVDGDRAEVLITVADGYPDYVYCVLTDAGWGEILSGNGPVVEWHDHRLYDWNSPA